MKNILFTALASASLLVSPAWSASLQFLVGDQDADKVLFAADLNDDGDTNDPGEVTSFFDETNASGLTAPAGNVFAIAQTADGAVFLGEGDTDTVYRVKDLNGNNNANDADEAAVWFSAANAGGFALNTPNGVAVGPDGAIYIVDADTGGNPTGDVVYRTVDLNGDGDANDAGEAEIWFDINSFVPGIAPFEIHFDGEVGYIAVTGANPQIIRVEDTDGDGTIQADEASSYVSGPAAPFTFGFDVDDNGDIFAVDLIFDQIFRHTDISGDGVIDPGTETSLVADIFAAGGGATFTLDEMMGEILVTSNGFNVSPEEDAIFRLIDLNGDGDFLDPGETVTVLRLADQGMFPIRPRSVAFYDSVLTAVPLPAGGVLLISGLFGLGWLARRRQA
ncbi:MAG: VPLPA-CTERM sorting domain-containing protein [Pseudomonadota bacterium]